MSAGDVASGHGDRPRGTARLALDALTCESVLERAGRRNPASVRAVLLRSGATVHVTTVDDVLYLPDLHLQVVDGTVVPTEGIVDPWNLGFEQRSDFHGRGNRYRLPFAVGRVEAEVAILSNLYSANFTHFIEESLKVIILERSGFAGSYVLTAMPAFAFELLALLGIDSSRIIDDVVEPTVFRRALYTTQVFTLNLTTCPGVLMDLREALLSAVRDVSSPAGSRLWLERGSNVTEPDRDLVNVEEVHACLDRHGFERLDIGSLPLREQLAAARDADVVSGVHGSAFAHCAFMKPGSRVIECFSPLYLNGCSFETCRVLGHRYHMVCDWSSKYVTYEHGDRVHVDPSQLELAMQGLG